MGEVGLREAWWRVAAAAAAVGALTPFLVWSRESTGLDEVALRGWEYSPVASASLMVAAGTAGALASGAVRRTPGAELAAALVCVLSLAVTAFVLLVTGTEEGRLTAGALLAIGSASVAALASGGAVWGAVAAEAVRPLVLRGGGNEGLGLAARLREAVDARLPHESVGPLLDRLPQAPSAAAERLALGVAGAILFAFLTLAFAPGDLDGCAGAPIPADHAPSVTAYRVVFTAMAAGFALLLAWLLVAGEAPPRPAVGTALVAIVLLSGIALALVALNVDPDPVDSDPAVVWTWLWLVAAALSIYVLPVVLLVTLLAALAARRRPFEAGTHLTLWLLLAGVVPAAIGLASITGSDFVIAC